MIWGVTPYNGACNLYAVVQGKPNTEYTSVVDAFADNDNTLNVYPSNDFLRRHFLPVARTIIQKNGGISLLPNGFYAEDYRGGIAGGISSGGGLSEADPLSVHKDGSVSLTADWNVGGFGVYGLSFVNSSDWSNVSITESQISDLSHTVDTNETTRVNNIAGFSCGGTDKVSSFGSDGLPVCTADSEGSGAGTYDWNYSVDGVGSASISDAEVFDFVGNPTECALLVCASKNIGGFVHG